MDKRWIGGLEGAGGLLDGGGGIIVDDPAVLVSDFDPSAIGGSPSSVEFLGVGHGWSSWRVR